MPTAPPPNPPAPPLAPAPPGQPPRSSDGKPIAGAAIPRFPSTCSPSPPRPPKLPPNPPEVIVACAGGLGFEQTVGDAPAPITVASWLLVTSIPPNSSKAPTATSTSGRAPWPRIVLVAATV